jgi:hypothetical protein
MNEEKEFICSFCDARWHGTSLFRGSPWPVSRVKVPVEYPKRGFVYVPMEPGQCICGAWFVGEDVKEEKQ